MRVELPGAYPYRSPSIGFVNKIYHPNVDLLSGTVCLDVINQTWSPMFDLVNVFEVFLPQLLLYPNPTDPLNGEAAALLLRDPPAYAARVKEFVVRFASGSGSSGGAGGGGDGAEAAGGRGSGARRTSEAAAGREQQRERQPPRASDAGTAGGAGETEAAAAAAAEGLRGGAAGGDVDDEGAESEGGFLSSSSDGEDD